MMELITCKNLSPGYEGKTITRNLNFSVHEGDYFCIVGENGAGKSTLMRTLLNLQRPVEGTIQLAKELKQTEIGYLPQQSAIQKDFPASVKEIVLSGCQGRCGLRPFYNKKEKALAENNIEQVGITELSHHCYRELSGGQQQRVLLARALCAANKVLLLDEPVTGLDPAATADMYQLIESLNKKGMTIIMISHDIEAAIRYASHILHIGKTSFYGTKEDYLQSEIGKRFVQAKGGEK